MVKLKSMSFQNKQEQAFTLAEVLITLGIIGVVAALTLPSLINRTKNRELHTAFLKTYSELNQVEILCGYGRNCYRYFICDTKQPRR